MQTETPTTSDHARTRLGRLGAWAFRRRRRVLAGWALALVAAVALLTPLAGDYEAEFTTPGSDSEQADAVLSERFAGDRSSYSLDVVWRSERGARSPEVSKRMDAMLAEAARLEGIGAVTGPEVSPDGKTAIARLQVEDDEAPEATAERLLELREQTAGDGLQVELAGWDIQEAQASETSPEAVGFMVAAVILLVTFGSLIAAGLPLLTALFGLGVTTALVGLLAAVMDVPDFAPAVAGMIGIGVGIDYALLVVTRFRAALARGLEVREAVAEATATAGRSVVVAGLTVVIAMLGLMAMGLPFLNGVAIAASLAVLVAVVAAITLLPASLGLIGRRIDRLHVPGSKARVNGEGSRRWMAWSRWIQRRPWAALVAGVALVTAMALPVTDFHLGFPDAGNDPEETTTRKAYDLVSEAFGPGANGPLLVTAELPAGADAEATLAELRERVAQTPGVAAVSPPQLDEAGDAAVLVATPETSPQDAETEALVERLREDVVPAVERSGAEVHVGGTTAGLVDQSEYTLDRLPVMIAVVVGLSFLLLLTAFRSIPVAVKAGFMNLLSIAAAYGVMALLAQGGFAGELIGIDTETPVPPFVPVMTFAVLFGLSMDYEVFLLSRIREEYLAGARNGQAVADGLAKTGRVITAAALIMVAVFSAFALSDDVVLKLMGVGMATAIFVDATIVRMLLVPAVMQILGRANWWIPRWLDRLLPRLNAHGTAPATAGD
jgi:RND superfamily putative drug exporter